MKPLFQNKRYIVSIFLTILIVFCTHIVGYADITPVSERTPQVRDAIVAEVPGVNSANDVTRVHLAAITSLDLNSKKITALKTTDFEGLSGLTALYLDDNQLRSLPAGIFDELTDLKTLRLDDNQLRALPDGIFNNLTNLTHLGLSANQFSVLPVSIFDKLTNLTSLGLIGNQLRSLPSGIFNNNTTLTHLYLSGNGMRFFQPGLISRLTNLTTLTIGDNDFTLLSSNIFSRLTNLTHLHMTNNNLTRLPATIFSRLTSLTQLDLGGSNFTSLPSGIFSGLTNLKRLSLGSSDLLTTLPAGIFSDLTNLTTLYIGSNNFKSLPAGIFSGLTSLTSLNVRSKLVGNLPLTVALEKGADGQFKTVAPAGAPFDIVLPITVTNGSINGGATSITIPAGSMESEVFTVTFTPGATAAGTVNIGTLPGLPAEHEGYTLAKSTGPPSEFTHTLPTGITPVCDRTPQVRDAIVAAVPGINGCKDITAAHLAAITSLELGSKSIRFLKTGDFSGLTALEELELNHNGLTTLPSGIFDNLTNLTSLDLYYSYFTTVPDAVLGLTSLTELNLGFHRITAIPNGAFDKLTQLEHLVLDGAANTNKFTTLPDGVFDQLTSLRSLDLSQNDLTSLPAGVFDNLTSLESLDLNRNYDLTSLPDDVFDNLVSLRFLTILGRILSTGDLSALSSLEYLNLNTWRLNSLPDGIFSGLSFLERLILSYPESDLPFTVSIEKVADGQFKAVAPPGAPFNILLPLTVTNGSISGGASSITISKGSTESGTLAVTRTSGTTAAVTVNIGTLPGIPSDHSGYTLVKSTTDLPLTVISEGITLTPVVTNNAPVFTDGATTTRTIAENTASGQHIGAVISATDADNDTLTWTLGGTDAAAFGIDATTGQLKTSAALDYETKASYSVTVSVADGNGGTDSITVTINVTDVNEIPITPVSDRTPKVRDAIVTAVPNVSDAANVTAAHLAAITSLNLRKAGITALKKGDFAGMTGLTSLNLFNNQLSSLPDGIFAGLTSLTTIRLGRNAVDPLPLAVSLEKVGTNQFKAVAPAGATFDIVLPITVTNGSISGSATTLTIPHGSVESGPLTVTRTPGTTADVTVDIGTLPSLPRNHFGYAFVKSDSLPITIISGINTAPVFTDGANTTRSVAENTATGQHIGTAVAATDAENDTLTYMLSGTESSAFDIDSTIGQLKTKALLDYETKTSYTVTLTVSDGNLTDTITVTINVTDVDEVVTPPITPDPPTTNSAPVFTEGDSTTRVIAENTPAGTKIGNAVLATDANNDFLAYTLGGVDANTFDIDSATGQLKTKASLDYETKRVYLVTITVDDEELSSTITVIISVIDVNDTVLSAGFVPVADRTPQVRDAIVTAVPNVTVAADVTESQVAAITNLNLRNKGIASLKTGDFSGMTSLSNLNLFGNQLSSLPAGTFYGLTALSVLRLGSNAVDPMPLIVSLQQTGTNTFKAVITTGAPFNIELPLTVTGGSISGGTTSVTIPQGTMESTAFTLLGTAAKVSFGTLPGLPRNHFGYKLAQSTVCNRTEAVAAAIAKAVRITDCRVITELDLALMTSLDLSNQSIKTLKVGDFDDMLSLRTLYLNDNDLTSLPNGIFDDLVSLRELRLNSNKLTTVPGDIFSNLRSLTNLYLQSNDLSALPSDAFDGLSALSSINLQSNDLTSLPSDVFDGTPYLTSILLSNNRITSIPNGLFEGLMQLNQLHLSWNPLPSSVLSLQVSLQKVGTNQVKAVALSGAPFAILVPISVKNGTLAGGATALRIPIGTVESHPITVTRTAGTTDAVTADIGTLPKRPSLHNGYALEKGTGLPLEVLPPVNSPPVFTDGATTTRTVAENTVANANIGTAIAATDINKDKLTYTLGGTDADVFAIDSATGQLKTKVALDYETKSSYAVTLTVSDGKLNDTITVMINVSNVNEAPTFTDGNSVTREIAENTSAGENIGAVITATDPDNDTLTYSLGGTDASAFALGTTTGQLKTSAALDYETKSLYTLVLTVSDGNLTDTIAVTINVTNVDELPTRTNVCQVGDILEPGESCTYPDTNIEFTVNNRGSGQFLFFTSGNSLNIKDSTINGKSYTLVAKKQNDGSWKIDEVGVATSNNAPVFTEGSTATRTVLERTSSGVDIGAAVSATDADGHSLTYTLGGTDAAAFSINSTSGQLRTNAALDFETKSSYSVTITASDGTDTATIDVTINVSNATENSAPTFTAGTRTTRSVAENTGSGVDIGTPVAATDVDGDTLTYTLGGTDAASFSIASTSGQLRTSAALDYETKTSYLVTITVSDGNGGTDSINVVISVTDVDEAPANSAPVFSEGSSTSRSVLENTGTGLDIGSAVSATDADGDTLSYSLGGTDASTFSIDSFTGQLSTSSSLDYETQNSYSVFVNVSDSQGSSASITVTINVTNVNEAPVFTAGATTTRSIAENAGAGINIGSAVAATDPEESKLTYTLGGTNATSFSIDDATGQLKTKAALDYETKTSYTVTISVSDGNLTDTIAVTINVTDLDETPSNNPPVFTEGVSTTRSIPENTDGDSNIGTPISATDADNNKLAYLLSGTDASSFAIDGNTGQLKTNAPLNHETKASYTVTVTVSDGSGTDTITVTITVTDVNEPPVLAAGESITFSVAENTTAGENIGSALSATDPDEDDELTYSLGGTDAASFGIVSTSGQLQTKASLDFETKTSYSVTISVSDGNGGSDSIDVTVNVTDVDENRAPSFTDGDSTTRSVAENTGSGVDIGTAVSATDPDTGDTLTYTLGGDDAASFSINSRNGQLRTNAALDYENKTSYSVTITVSDSKLTDSITVTINVTDVDENRAPSFTDGDSTTRSVAENTGSGVDIGTAVSATDPDTGDTLTYTLGGDDAASFSINGTNGQLRTSAALNYESNTSYSLTITVSDSKLTDSITVTINVTNVNEAPAFKHSTLTRSVAENTAAGTNLGNALDVSDPEGDTLTYTLGGKDAASFSFDSTNRRLQTKAALDYETKTSYTVVVTVSDSGSLTDSVTITINVTDVSENNDPVFTDGTSTTRSVAENTASGTNIGTAIAATDADTGDTLTWTLGGTDASSFSIVSTSGQLQTNAALDYETKTSYSVTVSVSDGNGGSDSITVTINVTDVSENNDPVFTDGTSTTRSVAENTASGTNIGTAIAATDADTNDTLTYTLGGTDASSFSIVSTSGQLQTSAALDYETKTSYSVTVSVSDGNGGIDSITVTINVTDVDETTISPALSARTSQVRDAIVAAVPGVTDADDVTAAQLAAITILTLSYKRITSLKAGDFDGLTGLTKLSLSGNKIASFPSGIFDELTALTELILNSNDFTSLSSGIFDKLTNLSKLYMDSHDMTSIPSGIFDKLTNLTLLDLGPNPNIGLRSLPSGIFDKLTNLVELRLYYNPLRSLTSGMFDKNTKLTTLVLDRMGLSSLPSDIFDKNTKLTKIRLGYNLLSSLPSNIFDELTALKTLELKYNRLSSLPTGIFDENTELTGIWLLENSLSSLPSGIFDENTKLTELYLNSNSLSSLSSGIFDNNTALKKLVLSDNSLSSLPSDIFDELTALTTLFLSDNQITDVSEIEGLTSLTSLYLNGNSISDYGPLRRLKAAIDAIEDHPGLTLDITIPPVSSNNVPTFTDGTSTTRSVAEGTAASQNIGTAVGATDTDTGDTLTYTLGGTDSGSFSIVSTSGQLQTSAALDYETKSSYSVTVSVSDGNGGSDSIEVTINVTDVDEAGNDPPTFTDGSSTTRSVAENTASGQNIGDAVAATDSDSGDTLTYTLGGTDASSFSIVSTSGQLQTKAALDYETKTSYSVTVSVSDGNSGSDSITVTINVTDVEESGTTTYNVGDTIPGFPFQTGTFSFTTTLSAGGTVYTCASEGQCTITNGEVTAGTITVPAESGAPSGQEAPKQTTLLPNFPNPFNPETWIPYQLAKPSEVTITIYDIRGRVVRVLVLGHQAAGIYRSRSKAALWDGRNHFGEKVATGVYFYRLTAGDFSATRKMLIQK